MAIQLYRNRSVTKKIIQNQYVLFIVGDVFYCLPIEQVREILLPQSITKLPHAANEVKGVTHHRGEVVPIVDLRARFGLPEVEELRAKKRVKWVMAAMKHELESSPHFIALVVDQVHYVFATSESPRSAPSLGKSENTRGVRGVFAGHIAGLDTSTLIFVLDTKGFQSDSYEVTGP